MVLSVVKAEDDDENEDDRFAKFLRGSFGWPDFHARERTSPRRIVSRGRESRRLQLVEGIRPPLNLPLMRFARGRTKRRHWLVGPSHAPSIITLLMRRM